MDKKKETLDKIKKISLDETKSPIYSLYDFFNLEIKDFKEVFEIINGPSRFDKLLNKDFLGELFFRILSTCKLLSESAVSKVDFINAITSDLSKTFEDNILLNGTNLWCKDEKWELIDTDVSKKDLENFIKKAFFIPGVIKINITEMDKISKSAINSVFSTSSDNNVYQFNNYFIEKGSLEKGNYQKSLPKYIIAEDIEIDKNVKLPKEVYELVSHLCSHNDKAIETLLDHIAMIFCNDFDMRQAVAKAVYLYGTTGENGKSTFLNFISSMVNAENTHSVTDLSDKSDRFQAMNSMVALFPDAEKYWSSTECEFIKQGVTSDKMSGRDLYKSAISKRYSFSIFVATNHLIKVEDKTGALFRRLLVISCNEKLIKKQEWFSNLKSKETLNKALIYFVNRYLEIRDRKNWELNTFSESEYALQMFRNNTDIVSYYVESNKLAEQDLNYKPTRYVYQDFLEFCYEIGIDNRNILQMNNFNSQLEVVLPNLKQQRVTGRTILNQLGVDEIYCGGRHERNNIKSDDPRSYIRSWDESNHNNTFRCWRVKE